MLNAICGPCLAEAVTSAGMATVRGATLAAEQLDALFASSRVGELNPFAVRGLDSSSGTVFVCVCVCVCVCASVYVCVCVPSSLSFRTLFRSSECLSIPLLTLFFSLIPSLTR